MMKNVKPPRSVFVDFPLGRQCGRPGDINLQLNILKDTFDILVKATIPGELVDLRFEWDVPFSWEDYQRDVEQMVKDEGGTIQHWAPEKSN
jgi:hypothetical protein